MPSVLIQCLNARSEMASSSREAYLFLYEKLNSAGVNPSRTKIKNWLNVRDSSEGDSGPNMGDDGREAMFQIAFSLSLSVAETEDFFRRVYLDKAFNARNVKECVYFYCLMHGRSYSEAQELVDRAYKVLCIATTHAQKSNNCPEIVA